MIKSRLSSKVKGIKKEATEALENHHTEKAPFLKHGQLWKRGGGHRSSSWKLRYFGLTEQKKMYYYEEKGTNWDEKQPKGLVELKGYELQNYSEKDKSFTFKLVPIRNDGRRTWYLCARTEKDFKGWTQILTSVLSGTPIPLIRFDELLMDCQYEINPSDLVLRDEMIGKGSFGVVKRATWLRIECAVKRINNVPEFIDNYEVQDFYREIQTLSKLRHPNIVSMYGYCKLDGQICLVTEYIPGGDLTKYLYDTSVAIPIKLKIKLGKSIAGGMAYLHRQEMVHRDLKPGNILVENLSTANLRVCDFGLSKITKNDQSISGNFQGFIGTPAYAAPELGGSDRHTSKVDVYSFGIILWEIVTRKKAFDEVKKVLDIVEKVREGVRPELSSSTPLNNLIEQCWDPDPTKRPSFLDILSELEDLEEEEQIYFQLSEDESHGVSIPPPEKIEDATPEEEVDRCFGEQKVIPWKQFSEVLAKAMEIPFSLATPQIEQIRYLLDTNGVVERTHWLSFLEWFSPLVIHDAYNTAYGTDKAPKKGFSFDEILDIVSPSFFFGFLSTNQAKEILSKEKPGTFLFRFSSKRKQFTLSTIHSTGVGHWRITCEIPSVGVKIFKIEENAYSSFYDIIERHKNTPLTSANNPRLKASLVHPLKRSDYMQNTLNIFHN